MDALVYETDYKVTKIQLPAACTRKISSSKYYSVLLILSGHAVFSWNGGRATCGCEDIVLMKPGSVTSLLYQGGEQPFAAIFIQTTHHAMKMISDETTDLEIAFNVVPFIVAPVHIGIKTLMLCKNLAQQLSLMPEEKGEFAHTIFERNLLSILMVLLLRGCMGSEYRLRKETRRHLYIDDVFAYIAAHVTEDLTLEKLERVFFVSKSHLAREFKRQTGETLHRYILKAKLDYCLPYIEAGYSIAEVYKIVGFAGYNHFFRAFKLQYGLSPKAHYRNTVSSNRSGG